MRSGKTKTPCCAILLKPIEETWKEFPETLAAKMETVNRRIADGANQHIKLKGHGEKRRWSLVYPEEEESINSPFYSQLPSIGIADLLWFVAETPGFWTLSRMCSTGT